MFKRGSRKWVVTFLVTALSLLMVAAVAAQSYFPTPEAITPITATDGLNGAALVIGLFGLFGVITTAVAIMFGPRLLRALLRVLR